MGDHNHNQEVSGKGLLWSVILNVAITVAEVIGGIISGSMALLSDATHNFSDVLSLIISYLANKLSRKKATDRRTYGYRRSEIMAAFINSATLIILAVFIFTEAVERIITPQFIRADWVIWLSILSIIINGLSVMLIRKDSRGNINIKSAYLHLFSDMLTSVAVLIGGLTMKFFHWYSIDSIFSILISIYLIVISWKIFSASLRVLMQFTPKDINIPEIVGEIEKNRKIKNLHHVHVWQISEHDIMFEAHVDVSDNISITQFEQLLEEIGSILKKYNINHVTIQPEFSVNDSKSIIHEHPE